MRRNIAISILSLFLPLLAYAGPRLQSLDIHVLLQTNGDALITETRHMSIDSEGTECYIVLGHLDGSEVQDLKVTDETGLYYENIGSWDINKSRSYKSGRCGIVRKHDGFELCWGLGDSGERTYITSYTVTNLLKGYTDADGFNYMFVAQGVKPLPKDVKLTITMADGTPITDEQANIWGFRFIGDINFINGAIVAQSSEPFERRSAMIVMVEFMKGLFSPNIIKDQSFEEIQQTAFEGSDYNLDEEEDDIWPLIVFLIFIILFMIAATIVYFFYKWWERRKVMNNLVWYRDLPFNGQLQEANNVLNAYKYFSSDYNNLLSACILRLIDIGAISIESHQNEKGKVVQDFKIHLLNDSENVEPLVKMVHNIFLKAAGEDTILEPKELRNWMRQQYNQSTTDSFIQKLHSKTYIYQYRKEQEEVRRLYGLKKFLKEFSLLDERHVNEVSLWKDYMIYATLFGIADQVIRDMKRINPEYFNMDTIAQQMADDLTLPTIYSTFHTSTVRAAMSRAEREARVSGSGGRVSFGGGGGFSGGGFGGGVR